MNESEEPASPCISVCLLDEDDICVGCYRSANEITEWFTASAEVKREMLRAQPRAAGAGQPRAAAVRQVNQRPGWARVLARTDWTTLPSSSRISSR